MRLISSLLYSAMTAITLKFYFHHENLAKASLAQENTSGLNDKNNV